MIYINWQIILAGKDTLFLKTMKGDDNRFIVFHHIIVKIRKKGEDPSSPLTANYLFTNVFVTTP